MNEETYKRSDTLTGISQPRHLMFRQLAALVLLMILIAGSGSTFGAYEVDDEMRQDGAAVMILTASEVPAENVSAPYAAVEAPWTRVRGDLSPMRSRAFVSHTAGGVRLYLQNQALRI